MKDTSYINSSTVYKLSDHQINRLSQICSLHEVLNIGISIESGDTNK